MQDHDYDLYVLGAGSGGVRAARIAGALGAKVGICENKRLGGTCVNVGCVPKKLLVYASHFHDDFDDAGGFGWTVGDRQHDWARLIAAKDKEIARLNHIYERLLTNTGCDIHEGRGRLIDAHTVEVAGTRYTAKHLLIAVGGRPWMPDFPGAEHASVSDAVFELPELPKRIVVVGGGYIGVEMAGIFHGLGAEVTLINRSGLPLRGFDEDIRAFLATEIMKRGIRYLPDTQISCIEAVEHGYDVVLHDQTTVGADFVLYATGRVPNTTDLGLDAAGVLTSDKGAILVADDYRTSVPHIYAVGDVIDRAQLTPVALAEGMLVARRLFGGPEQAPPRYDLIPTAVFSQPNVGTVGLTEQAARAAGHAVTIFRSSFRPMKHTLSGRDEKTMMKLVVDADTDAVLGVHMVGPEAGEIIQGFGVALMAGATKATFDATIGIHPTAAEEFVTMRTPVPDPV